MFMTDVPKFEANNNVATNVFGFDNQEKILLFLSKSKNKRINLLLITDGIMYHYCLITNYNAFMSKQFETETYCRKFCERCLHGFSSQTVLLEHVKLYGQHDAVSIRMPPEKSFISFRHWFKTSLCPFTIYADTEAICRNKLTCKTNPLKAGTTKLEEQVPCSFGALLVDKPNKRTTYKHDRGPNCMENFFNWIRVQPKNISASKQKI